MFSHQVLRACTFAFLDGKQHVFVIGLGALQVRELEDGLRTIDAECTRIGKGGLVDMVESGAKRLVVGRSYQCRVEPRIH